MSTFTKSFITSIFLISLLNTLPSLVSAHSHITEVIVDGKSVPGYPSDDPGSASPSSPVWPVVCLDNGFVSDPASPDMICGKMANPAKSSATIAAGGTITFVWKKWPSHQGPVITYMAKCPGKCENVDKNQLKWFKIDQLGLLSLTPCNEYGNSGCWALDKLRQAGERWSVTIPSDLEPGEYVIRHEVINLDFEGIPQYYPYCASITVTGGGSWSPQGVVGTSLYTGQEPGLNFKIWNMKSLEYPIPGPPLATRDGSAGNTNSPTGSANELTASDADSADYGTDSPEDDSGTCESPIEKPKVRARRWVA